MFFVVRSNDSFNFPLGVIKYIVIVVIVIVTNTLPFEHHGETVRWLAAFRDLCRNQLWQWSVEGCRKPVQTCVVISYGSGR